MRGLRDSLELFRDFDNGRKAGRAVTAIVDR